MGTGGKERTQRETQWKDEKTTRQIDGLEAAHMTHEFVLVQGADIVEKIVALADRDL